MEIQDADAYEGFEFDPSKREQCLAKHGIDFIDAVRIFDNAYFEREDTRRTYGEPRYIATGKIDDVYISIVWTPRGKNRRIITAWRTSKRERSRYP
jgi:uncharacterized DUF497 family protein